MKVKIGPSDVTYQDATGTNIVYQAGQAYEVDDATVAALTGGVESKGEPGHGVQVIGA